MAEEKKEHRENSWKIIKQKAMIKCRKYASELKF